MPFALGMLLQDKLIATKFMASQFAIELTLEQSAACIFASVAGNGNPPTYVISNVALLPEMLVFDSVFDETFVEGLENGGVMYKFASWRQYTTSINSANINFAIAERSRWIKAIFVMQKRSTPTFTSDQGACLFDTSILQSSLQSYQLRAGGKFYPPSPVECTVNGGSRSNGGSEAYIELAKALRSYGDKRLSSSVNTTRWAVQPGTAGILHDQDYKTSIQSVDANGVPTVRTLESDTNAFGGNLGSQMFIMAANFDSSTRGELAGLNGEEQNSISFIANWKESQVGGTGSSTASIVAYTYYDSIFILGANNTAKLVE